MAKTYNAKQVIVTWGATELTPGMPESGTTVEVDRTSVAASLTPILGGSAVVNVRNDKTGMIRVSLLASSDANEALTEALLFAEEAGTPAIAPMMVNDVSSGKTKHSTPIAVIEKFPTMTYTENVPTLTWTFLCTDLKMEPRGGNDI